MLTDAADKTERCPICGLAFQVRGCDPGRCLSEPQPVVCACGKAFLNDRYNACPECDAGRLEGRDAERQLKLRRALQAGLEAARDTARVGR
jgi:hypothetical protein